jgi:hypothetical protein
MENREKLDKIGEKFKEWLHVDDLSLLHTLLAVKVSHQLDGDPIWLMVIGPSSGGKSEYMRAMKLDNEIKIDDLTPRTFVTAYRVGDSGDRQQLAERLANKIWYLPDLSIMMSKHSDERSQILSDMRMIYDGEIVKEYGTKERIEIQCPNNTLICSSTPSIDRTMLEDQLLGTRFITYRLPKQDRHGIMKVIDINEERIPLMRENLNMAVKEYMSTVEIHPIKLTPLENQNLQLLANMTTLLRTAVDYDRSGEPANIAYPEEPGRVYKQLKKLYQSYKIIGLTADESIKHIRKVCIDNINPVRIRLLKYLYTHKYLSEYEKRDFSTSQLHSGTGLGKKTVKQHMHAFHMMDMVDYDVIEDQFSNRIRDKWSLRSLNLNLLLGGDQKMKASLTLFQLYRKNAV